MPRDGATRRLRVLTWHVHGNYLYYLSHIPHELWLVTKPRDANGRSEPGYAGRSGVLPWGANVHELPYERVREAEFDCVLYQSRHQYDDDRHTLLSPAQRRLPALVLEHDPPQEHPTGTRHWAGDDDVLIVHVTHFNALMWDNGRAATTVVEHGVVIPENVRYSGEIERGIVVVNHLARRGRRLGADVFAAMRERVPLDLVGMDAESAGGIGEIDNLGLPAFIAHYRLFFHPIRYTSLGLALVEAMMIGMPVVGLATTELATVIRNGDNGYIDTNPETLAAVIRALLRDPGQARNWGDAARRDALARFSISRFVSDWNETLLQVTQ